MKTIAFHTLGCKVNSYETEAMWQLFKNNGYRRIDFDKDADIYLINTCTVTNTGDKKSRQTIRRAVRKNPDAVIIVTGCYAQTSPAEVAGILGVDIVVGTQGREKLLQYVDQVQAQRQPINAVSNVMKQREFEEMDVPDFAERTRASLKIQEGCNNFCTFCIIPWAKGLSRSRNPENVLTQARQLVANGYKEIVLTGIHTGGYGEDLHNYSLADLLWDLDKIEELHRIRISSIEASQVNNRVIEVLKTSSKICPHLHIPLQAGDDEVLRRMRRKYTTAEYKETILKLQAAMPEVAITTDVIVGFPGETEAQFIKGYNFIKSLGFFQLHIFPYSKRTGTPAAKMIEQIDEQVKQHRVKKLISLSEHLADNYAEKFLGQVLEVIPEKLVMGQLIGHAGNYLQVTFPGHTQAIGEVCKVKINKVNKPYCEGEFLRVVG